MQVCVKSDEVGMALQQPCAKFGAMSDFSTALDTLTKELIESRQVLAKAAVILSENILAHCLKAFVPEADFPQGEKNKRRNLLVSQMGKIKDGMFGQQESMLHPTFAELAALHMKPSGP